MGSQGLPSEGMGAVGGCGAIWSCGSLFLGAVPPEDMPWDLLSHRQPVSGPVLTFFFIFFFCEGAPARFGELKAEAKPYCGSAGV